MLLGIIECPCCLPTNANCATGPKPALLRANPLRCISLDILHRQVVVSTDAASVSPSRWDRSTNSGSRVSDGVSTLKRHHTRMHRIHGPTDHCHATLLCRLAQKDEGNVQRSTLCGIWVGYRFAQWPLTSGKNHPQAEVIARSQQQPLRKQTQRINPSVSGTIGAIRSRQRHKDKDSRFHRVKIAQCPGPCTRLLQRTRRSFPSGRGRGRLTHSRAVHSVPNMEPYWPTARAPG